MKNVNINARIKRNKLDELAGKYFMNESSEIVKHLRSINKTALLGIQREDGIYTIIGEQSTYYLTVLGIEGEIPHENFLKILRKSALALGKNGEFEYINITEKDSIWLLNAQVMNALWNTIMLLYESR